MILEKVYDELIGMIEDLQKKVGKGGSAVTIMPTLESGVKLADFSIDSTEGAIYAPQQPPYSTTPQIIDKWIDGTTIKRVVYNIDNPFAESIQLNLTLPDDYGFLIDRYGSFVRDIGSSGLQHKAIEYRTEEPANNQYGVACYIGNDNPADPLQLRSTLLGYTASQITNLIIVLDYAVASTQNTKTKTTKKK